MSSRALQASGSPRSLARRAYALLLRPEASVIVVSVALVLYFEIANANFVTPANVQTLSQFVAAPVIIACGEIMLLICREIDLSVGQVFALAPFLMENINDVGVPEPLAIVAALAACALIGLTIGLITIGLRVPSFITTLGMLFLITGLTLTISRGYPANTAGGPLLTGIMGEWAYSEIIWALVIVAIMHVVLRHTRWGLHTVAIGGNIIAAAEAGIAINRIKVGNFVLTSTLGGLTGLLEARSTRWPAAATSCFSASPRASSAAPRSLAAPARSSAGSSAGSCSASCRTGLRCKESTPSPSTS